MKEEKTLCAAIWFDDGKPYRYQPINIKTGIVFCRWRHGNIFVQAGGSVASRQRDGIKTEQQGFLTSKNRFVDRHEAYAIAEKAGQILPSGNKHPHGLFSEDLY